MTCKSSKPTSFDPFVVGWCRRLTAGCFAVLLLVAAVATVSAQDAASPTASPSPGSTPKPQGYVRFWNMLMGKNAPDLQLMVTDARALTTAQSGNYYAGYMAVDPATYTFTVRRPGDPNAVVKRLPVALRGDVYVTLLAVAGKDGKPDVQLIDDTPNPKTDDGLGTVVVRQFVPGASVTVGAGGPPVGTPLAFGDAATLDKLPIRGVALTMQATGLGPAPKSWTVDVDFANGGHHATMIIIADPYGRFRPRLVFDGTAGKPPPPPTPPGAPRPVH